MDKVQFQLESTLPELKDLHEKGLFTKHEIDQITKRRTAFETSLIRRVSRKEDFFKYAEYEINLERLRKVRYQRLKYHINPPPPSASTYSIPRRVSYILKRATAKFPGDLAVWLAYIEYASREGMRKIVTRGLTSALQYHPLSPTLYLLSSYHHLHPGSPFPRSAIPSASTLDLPQEHETRDTGFSLEGTSPARTTLLLGLRLLPQSHDLWREYIKLELGWVEALRRRWDVLGINNSKPQDEDTTLDSDAAALVGGEGAFGPEGESARKAILAGQLVVQAIRSALESISTLDFRDELVKMLRIYPSPLRTKALEVVYEDLGGMANIGGRPAARARLSLLTRNLYERPYDSEVKDDRGVVLQGVKLVEEIGRIGKEIRRIAKMKGSDWRDVAGEWIAARMDEYSSNIELREYLLSILASLTKPSSKPSPSLLLLHLSHLPNTPAKLGIARSYAEQHPLDPKLQGARINAEIAHNQDIASVRKCCKEALRTVTRSDLSNEEKVEVQRIWRAYADWEVQSPQAETDVDAIWHGILVDSLKLGTSLPDLHPALLSRYFVYYITSYPDTSVAPIIETISKQYRPRPAFFSSIFNLINGHTDLSKMYEAWQTSCKTGEERVDAGVTWAGWLLRNGKGLEANRAMDVVRRQVKIDGDASGELERRWLGLLDEMEVSRRKGSGDEDMSLDEEDGEPSEEEEDDLAEGEGEVMGVEEIEADEEEMP